MSNDLSNNADEKDHPTDSGNIANGQAGAANGDNIDQQINTGGGASFAGQVNAAKDVIGGNQINIFYVGQSNSPAEQEFTWQHLLQNSRKQLGLFWLAARGTETCPGIYVPELVVSSPQIESELEAFLNGEAAALIVLGETGLGKTNLLCQWTADLSQAGHAVFYYDCAGSIHDNIETGLARDLGANSVNDLDEVLHQISDMAAAADSNTTLGLRTTTGPHLILIFDAINEFRRPNQVGTDNLLRQIDALVGHLPERNVKLIFSCRTVPWRQMQNAGKTKLLWHRYHQPQGADEPLLLLQPFDSMIFAKAYDKYRVYFNLQTKYDEIPSSLRENLLRPYFLRMTAETYRDRGIPVTQDALFLNVFRRFYEERIRPATDDEKFIEELVGVMYEQSRSILWIDDLEEYQELYAQLLDEHPDNSYQRMLARGVLSETPGDFFQSAQVRFLYDPIGSFALARLLSRRNRDGSPIIQLIREKRDFHLAWEAALILLLRNTDAENFASAARSPNPDLRALVVDSLKKLHADQPQVALDIINHLLKLDSTEAQVTALKAAYFIGPPAQSVFLDIASNQGRDLRRLTKDALYLNWQTDPQFVENLLYALVERIDLKSPRQMRYILEFIIDLSITIYINNCDDEKLPQKISDLYYELIKNRLRLDLLDIGFLGPAFGKLIAAAVGSAMARPVMDAFQYTETTIPYRETYATDADKDHLKQVLHLIEPGSDLRPKLDMMAGMLQSKVTFINLLAAMPLAVQATCNFAAAESVMRQLFDQVNGHGRLWVILSLAVQFKNTPAQWVALLEDLTRRLISENPEIYYDTRSGFLNDFDIVLLPLGFAYGKQGTIMPLFEEMLKEGLAGGQEQRLPRTLAALGPVGFYQPQAVFNTLLAAFGEEGLKQVEVQQMLVNPMSMMRILHLDDVDTFLQRIGAGEAVKRDITTETDIGNVSNYIYRLGIYNNTIYDALYHPKMSRNFFIGSMEVLIDKQEPKAFLEYYTETAIRMTREADYQLIEWTLPE